LTYDLEIQYGSTVTCLPNLRQIYLLLCLYFTLQYPVDFTKKRKLDDLRTIGDVFSIALLTNLYCYSVQSVWLEIPPESYGPGERTGSSAEWTVCFGVIKYNSVRSARRERSSRYAVTVIRCSIESRSHAI